MNTSKSRKPTDAELAILRVLWQRGPSTVREVWERLRAAQQTGYTTVLKLLQIMYDKGLVARDASARSHIYAARASEEQTQRQVIGHLLDGVFSGSAQNLVFQALSVKRASPGELAEIRKLIERMERNRP